MAVSSFDEAQMAVAAKNLHDARSSLTASSVADLRNAQTTGKWGIQAGPQRFMSGYLDTLSQICSTLDWLQHQVGDLAASTNNISKDATETDTQAAQQITHAWQTEQSNPPTPAIPSTAVNSPA